MGTKYRETDYKPVSRYFAVYNDTLILLPILVIAFTNQTIGVRIMIKVSSAVEMPNEKKEGKSWLQVQIDDELKTLLRVEAARHNVSMASIVENLIAQNLRTNSK